jgi:hypothetical protein
MNLAFERAKTVHALDRAATVMRPGDEGKTIKIIMTTITHYISEEMFETDTGRC